jgi:hypothetical protein
MDKRFSRSLFAPRSQIDRLSKVLISLKNAL